jgi:phosphatidylethanolamine/phosphatidyl-N-methylethanolamine N-methyltransferase
MSLPALQLFEKTFEQPRRILELKRDALERKIEQHIQMFEERRDAFERKLERQIETHRRKFEQKLESQKRKIEKRFRRPRDRKGIRLDDEVRFIRTWFEKPLTLGAVTPSGRALARTMAEYVDPSVPGPIIELGAGTGPVTEALIAQGIDPSRLVLVEFDSVFCRLLRARFPTAKVVQGDAYSLKRLLTSLINEPAAAVVSGLPLFTKPLQTRLRLLFEAFAVMRSGAPFVQFTYHTVPPIPKRLDRVRAEASERVWKNIPPARVWVYRRTDDGRQTTEDGRHRLA